jgi:serine/threonine protein kinase/tetratricopeptide (TPR) repeat protein
VAGQHDDDKTSPLIDLSRTSTVLHYVLIRQIGSGGMGEVYLAEDTSLNRKVALKFLSPHLCQDADCRARFAREAQAVAQLNHPNIVTIHQVSEFQGRPFFAMEYIQGKPISSYVKDNQSSIDDITKLIIQVCDGLREAHSRNIVHRDIKPANISVDAGGRVKILDFGLAHIGGMEGATKTGSLLGTVGYMSPEQASGKSIDCRSDIFSVGAVLYELITGIRAFTGDYDAAILYAIVNENPYPISRYRRDFPPELQSLIDRALHKHVDSRYQNCEDMIADLHRIQAKETLAKRVADKPKMLAVLPFRNLGSPEDEYFVAGMTDEVMTSLAKVKGLGIISRTSAQKYEKSSMSLPDIARELGVAYILEGTIRWNKSFTPARVRVTAQLIEVERDVHLWAESYDGVLSDIFVAQAEIAAKVTAALDLELRESSQSPAEKSAINPEAWDCFLQAKQCFGLYQPDTMQTFKTVETLLRRAISIQPDFAHAHAWLGLLHTQLYWMYLDRSAERTKQARNSLNRALEISPGLVIGHQFLGRYYYCVERDWNKAIEHSSTALEKNPNDSWVLADLAFALQKQGRWLESLDYLVKAKQFNPREPYRAYAIAWVLIYLRRFTEAREYLDEAISLSPNFGDAYLLRLRLQLLWNGDCDSIERAIPEPLEYCSRWPSLTYFEVQVRSIQGHYGLASALMTNPGEVHTRFCMKEIEFYCLLGDVYRYAGDGPSSAKAYKEARELIDSSLISDSENASLHSLAGRACGGIGLISEAKSHGERAVELLSVERDAVEGVSILRELAETYAIVGEPELAIEKLDSLLSIPSDVSVPLIRIWPDFKPLWQHPDWNKLLEKHGTQHVE